MPHPVPFRFQGPCSMACDYIALGSEQAPAFHHACNRCHTYIQQNLFASVSLPCTDSNIQRYQLRQVRSKVVKDYIRLSNKTKNPRGLGVQCLPSMNKPWDLLPSTSAQQTTPQKCFTSRGKCRQEGPSVILCYTVSLRLVWAVRPLLRNKTKQTQKIQFEKQTNLQ